MEQISGGSMISQRERQPLIWSENLVYYLASFFAEKCMKMKEPRGVRCASLATPWMQIAASLWPRRDVFH